ncbi:sporulation protein YtxC [Pseudalkalibacillus sp. Hm43]|uniref:sporulation protein YtxC n=1 Tax=Pseudalkalibacillus sp. Hm43 TaxID=3450742 RepID=UPI003F41E8A5
MVTIYFLDENEGHYLYRRVRKLISNRSISNRSTPVKVYYTEDHALNIDMNPRDPVSEMVKPTILNFFAKHIIRTREIGWILRILEHQYYFENEDEQQQILSIVQALMDGQHEDLPKIRGLPNREDVIVDALESFFDCEMMFSYESFLQFRLKPYRELLQEYIECGIDEFKLEQEYQDFIHQLRQFVKARVSLFSMVHLIHDRDEFRLFNQHNYELTEEDITGLLKENQQSFHDLIASNLLKLLIVIAPSKICLYTDDPDSSMNQTIQNIFQEKVLILPHQSFQVRHKNS